MKVMITGGTGFIGSHLAEELIIGGHNVLLYDIEHGNLDELKRMGLMQANSFVNQDIANYNIVRDVISKWKPDQIVHLAGISHTVASALGQRAALRPGVMGLATIQDVIRDCKMEKMPRVLIASSSLTSGMFPCPKTETAAVPSNATEFNLQDCYHQYVDNKLAMEMLCHSNYAQHGIPFTIMRFGTQYGPRMKRNVVTWYFIRNALMGKPLQIHGTGNQVRQHFYVKDLVAGMALILANEGQTTGRTISLVPDAVISVRDLACAVVDVVPGVQIEYMDRRPIDVRVNRIEPSKELLKLGWKIKWPLHEGLVETVKYYRERMHLVDDGFDDQIDEEN